MSHIYINDILPLQLTSKAQPKKKKKCPMTSGISSLKMVFLALSLEDNILDSLLWGNKGLPLSTTRRARGHAQGLSKIYK